MNFLFIKKYAGIANTRYHAFFPIIRKHLNSEHTLELVEFLDLLQGQLGDICIYLPGAYYDE